MTAPPNLDILRRIDNPAERGAAATAYIAERKGALKEAWLIRYDAILLLVDQGMTNAAVAAAVGVSVSTVKFVKRVRAAA